MRKDKVCRLCPQRRTLPPREGGSRLLETRSLFHLGHSNRVVLILSLTNRSVGVSEYRSMGVQWIDRPRFGIIRISVYRFIG